MGFGNFDFASFISRLKTITFGDVIDILVVAVLFYVVYSFIKARRAGKLAVGIALLAAIAIIAELFDLYTVNYIMTNFLELGLLALVVVFQPELRSALEKVGSEPLKGLKIVSDIKDNEKNHLVNAFHQIGLACADMSETKTGALIVLERTTNLDSIIKNGKKVNSDITSDVLRNIFYRGAPLHDGAVIIRDGRVEIAGCILPLSTNELVAGKLGTRHHAALGISEESDAVAIVVSEETGTISIACGGKLIRYLNSNGVERELCRIFEVEQKKTKKKNVKAAEGENDNE